MRSQQGPSRRSTLCLVPHLVSLSTSLRSVHVQQNCYYRILGHATRWREEVGAMSAKRKKRAPKSGAVWRMSAKEATLAKKPRYNGYACGHGGEMQNTAARNRNARGKATQAGRSPRGAPSFLPSTFIRAAESKGLMSPKEATPHLKRPLSAKDGTRFAQNMKKACRTRHAHAAESAPHDAQTRIGV